MFKAYKDPTDAYVVGDVVRGTVRGIFVKLWCNEIHYISYLLSFSFLYSCTAQLHKSVHLAVDTCDKNM